MLTNSVLIAVIVMLLLSMVRVHVVLSLFIGALAGGLLGGLGFEGTMLAFQEGLSGGAKIALSYALLGAFAMAVAQSGLPDLLAQWLIKKAKPGTLDSDDPEVVRSAQRATVATKYLMLCGIFAMAVMSQNVIPVHIAFIPLLIPPLLQVMNALKIDRRLVACTLTYGLVTTYMFLPVGFGNIFLNEILLGNIEAAGLDVSGINIMQAMAIPAAGMTIGLLIAAFVSYRKPREYGVGSENAEAAALPGAVPTLTHSNEVSTYRVVMSLVAVAACFGIQLWINARGGEADALLVGSMVGLAVFLLSGAIPWRSADDVFTAGMKMMALIGFIMISAQGFASVMNATGDVEPLVEASARMFAGSKPAAAFAMLVVGLIVTMGIGSSFSTLPIITAIYVPLCVAMGFSPLATVSIIGTAGALGDAGSPASDSTLGPTAGLNADGLHDHIRDSVIPTFLHFNLPLLAAGWVAAMAL